MKEAIDLASDQLRGYVLEASDHGFAPPANLLRSQDPEANLRSGPSVDGWETRRRQAGHDWAVIRLGVPGLIEQLEVDTTHFESSAPSFVSVEGCVGAHNALSCDLDGWVEILAKSPLSGNLKNVFKVSCLQRFSHLRLNIFPDGGVARFRAFGSPRPVWMAPGRTALLSGGLDLASSTNGAAVVASSDSRPGACSNLIHPSFPANKAQIWLTPRRREPGNDWVVVRLAAAGTVTGVTLDTAGLEGICPARAGLEAATTLDEPGPDDWFELLPPQTMVPETEHHFSEEVNTHEGVRWVRLNVYPDGGMARLRLWGSLTAEALGQARLAYLNACGEQELQQIFLAVCHTKKWALELAQTAPFESVQDLQRKAASAWSKCRASEWKEALAGHPRIGERAAGQDLASKWSRGEQSKASTPDQAAKEELRSKQIAYEEKFGFIFLICATGRSSAEILAAINERMQQSAEFELQTVAEELSKIIHLRLEKLIAL